MKEHCFTQFFFPSSFVFIRFLVLCCPPLVYYCLLLYPDCFLFCFCSESCHFYTELFFEWKRFLKDQLFSFFYSILCIRSIFDFDKTHTHTQTIENIQSSCCTSCQF